jgi:hypothetical protein
MSKVWVTSTLQQLGDDFPGGEGSDQACRVAERNFTREEWRRFVTGRSYERVCPELPTPG